MIQPRTGTRLRLEWLEQRYVLSATLADNARLAAPVGEIRVVLLDVSLTPLAPDGGLLEAARKVGEDESVSTATAAEPMNRVPDADVSVLDALFGTIDPSTPDALPAGGGSLEQV